jgi:class 3 adenylate cyclase
MMEQFSGCVVIVDISGYTQFVKMHRTAVAHAEQIITDLMESVLDVQGPPLVLDKLMGDAAIFYSNDAGDTSARAIAAQVMRFFDAFNESEGVLVSCNVCICDACTQMGSLKLKAILHHGELILKQMGGGTELAGPDVILAHRLLKNSVEGDEYILMTEAFHDRSGDLQEIPSQSGREETDLGPVNVVVFYPDSGNRPLPKATFSGRLKQFARIEAKGTQRMLRGRSAREFTNLPPG